MMSFLGLKLQVVVVVEQPSSHFCVEELISIVRHLPALQTFSASELELCIGLLIMVNPDHRKQAASALSYWEFSNLTFKIALALDSVAAVSERDKENAHRPLWV